MTRDKKLETDMKERHKGWDRIKGDRKERRKEGTVRREGWKNAKQGTR